VSLDDDMLTPVVEEQSPNKAENEYEMECCDMVEGMDDRTPVYDSEEPSFARKTPGRCSTGELAQVIRISCELSKVLTTMLGRHTTGGLFTRVQFSHVRFLFIIHSYLPIIAWNLHFVNLGHFKMRYD